MVRVTSLSSTCSPVAHEDEGLHAVYVYSLCNSDVLLALCYVICNPLCKLWIIRCNKDLCFLVLHLVLCVLAIDPGTSTDTHRDRHLKRGRYTNQA